jgi:D-alanyl-D-alanine carboxypeptidase
MLTQTHVIIGSTEPIQPVLVKTLTVKAFNKTASLVPVQVTSPAREAQPIPAVLPAFAATAPGDATPVATAAPVAAAEPERAAPSLAVIKAEPTPSGAAAAKPEPIAPAMALKSGGEPEVAPNPEATPTRAPAVAAKAEPAAAVAPAIAAPATSPAKTAMAAAKPASSAPAVKPAAAAAKPPHHPGWIIQVGAFPAEQAAKQRLSNVQNKASKMLTGAEAFTETVDKGGTTFYRARFAGLDKDAAEAACKYLKKNDVECVTIKN